MAVENDGFGARQIPQEFLKGSRLAKLVGVQARATRTFNDFPGCGGRFQGVTFALWALTADEVSRSLATAYAWCRETAKWSEESLLVGDGKAVLTMASKAHQLALSLRDPDDTLKPLASDGADVLRLMEPDEIGAMYERFLDWQQERSPLQHIPAGEVESFVEALGKGWTHPTSLASCDSASLRYMLLYTAKALHSQTRAPSSDTSPASDSSGSLTPPTP